MQVVIFILILSVLVLIHEAGHFVAAKIFKVKVEEFGIGLPPKAKNLFVKWGTQFSLNWLPIGGFVKLFGEEYETGDELLPEVKERFYNKPSWQRAIVFVAGVMMNFLLGIVLFAIVYSVIGIPTQTNRVTVSEIAAGSPAEKAGLKTGERIGGLWDMGGRWTIVATDQLVKLINEHKGQEITLIVIDKQGNERQIVVTPRENPPEGEGALGVALSNVELLKYPWWQMPFRGMYEGTKEALAWGRDIADGLGKIVYGLITGKGVAADVRGPIGIYQVSSQVVKQGLVATLQFVGILSVNLAILNVMPFPALDGGRLVFLAVEKIIGKRLKNKIEGYLNMAGMVLLLGFMLLITVRDVIGLIKR